MAAGQGFKTFTSGDVLTAADVNGYLMQGVGVFTDAANRDAEITSPQEGQFAYLKDTNVTTYYTGSAWANLDTTGMTNPMTTTGDTIYSSSGSTPARLGIGSTGNVLTVSGGLPVWAAPASSASMTLLSTTSYSGTSTTISSLSQSYTSLYFVLRGFTSASSGNYVQIRLNGDTGTNYNSVFMQMQSSSSYLGVGGAANDLMPILRMPASGAVGCDKGQGVVRIDRYTDTSNCGVNFSGSFYNGTFSGGVGAGGYTNSAAITSITFLTTAGSSTGTIYTYGVI